MNIIIAPDSFKGSLSTLEVSKHIKSGVLRVFPNADFQSVPMADGGEGTVLALVHSLGGEIKSITVTGPMGTPVKASFGILTNNHAVLEMAAASGLPLVPKNERDLLKATTYGTGELIKSVLDLGCRHITIGIGGSATNDGGVGMAQALGARFLDPNGKDVGFGGGNLSLIQTIDLTQLDKRLKDTTITVMCDVDNPLCGPKGASAVYGPQKGATPELVRILDENLAHLAALLKKQHNLDLADIPGAGAAGGLGMGLAGFIGAELKSGILAILEASEFETKLAWADLVITGEGRIDEQSVYGKVPTGISSIAAKYEVPVIAIVGSIGTNGRAVYDYHISTIESAVSAPMPLEQALEHAGEYLEDAAERVMRGIQLGLSMRV